MKRPLIIVLVIVLLIGGLIVTRVLPKKSPSGNDSMTNANAPIQSHRSYSLHLLSSTQSFQSGRSELIKFTITDETGKVLKEFALDHTKLMHFILVRKDLQDFQHVHPDFNKDTGEFTIPVTFPENGNYRLFADFTPASGQMGPDGSYLSVTSYHDVTIGAQTSNTSQAVVPDTQETKTVGSYQLTYKTSQPIQAGSPVTITIHVTKNGQAVTNMDEYLGAQAHGILLMKDSLDFAHLHSTGKADEANGAAMSHATMGISTSKGPDIIFTYTFPGSGIYKLFTQFQHEGKVITSDYIFNVK